MFVDVTFFEDTPLFTSPIVSESISQGLPIPFLVLVIQYTSVIDQSAPFSPTKPPHPLPP